MGIVTIFIALLSLVLLITLHELGHFLLAKKYNVKVDEFGIGIPPRVWGKRVGETLYSINLLPLGGFVRLQGEDSSEKGPRSFASKPVAQRLFIVAGGVIVFWIITIVMFTGLALTWGIPSAVSDDATGVGQPMVRIFGVASNSPAEDAQIRPGDIILKINGEPVTMAGEVISVIEVNKGNEVSMLLQRGRSIEEHIVIPRVDHPKTEGALGVRLGRVALVTSSWWQAPIEGVRLTGDLTWRILKTFGSAIRGIFPGKDMPEGMSVMGPIGIVSALQDSLFLGIPHFLFFVALLSLHLAVINILPIPALDGGRIAFLLVEMVRRKAVSEQVEKLTHTAFFVLLILLLIVITAQDIFTLFL